MYNRPVNHYNSGSKVESARLVSHQNGQSHSDLLIHNQLANRQQKIIANNKVPPNRRVPSGRAPISKVPSHAGLAPAPSAPSLAPTNGDYQQNDQSPLKKRQVSAVKRSDSRTGEPEQIINVRPHQKVYLNGAPGSCPPTRPQENLAYEQKYGKGPLIERQERLRRLQEVQKNMKPVAIKNPDAFDQDLQQGTNPANPDKVQQSLNELKEKRARQYGKVINSVD